MIGGKVRFKTVFKDPVYEKCDEAQCEVSPDGAVGAVIDRARPHLGLHDAEGFFNFPAGTIDVEDIGYGMMGVTQFVGILFEIGCHGIKSVISFFIGHAVLVDVMAGIILGKFSAGGALILYDVAPEVFWRFVCIAVDNGLLGFVEILGAFAALAL